MDGPLDASAQKKTTVECKCNLLCGGPSGPGRQVAYSTMKRHQKRENMPQRTPSQNLPIASPSNGAALSKPRQKRKHIGDIPEIIDDAEEILQSVCTNSFNYL